MIDLYVVRHAHSLSNQNKIAASLSEKYCGGLSKEGKIQAEKLASELSKNKYDIIIVSPLIRAQQTLFPFLRTFTYPPKIIFSELLLERDLGDLKGKTIEEVEEYKENDSNKDLMSWTPPNGESLLDVQKRAKEFISYVKKEFSEKSILVCGHSMFFRTLHMYLENVSSEDYASVERLQNGEIKKYQL